MFLQDSFLFLMGPNPASGKTVYKSCVKIFYKNFLSNRVDTHWRAVLHFIRENFKPEWRALFKSPLSKKVGDLQWRILHGAIAVNALVSIINPGSSVECPFCFQRETVFHPFFVLQ